jgi:hypothetical protein
MSPAMTPQQIDRLARRRANRKMGWYVHAFVFIVVNTGLALMSGFTGHRWAVFPVFGWGLGLLIHGAVVFAAPLGHGFRERLVQQERERLQQQQDKS